MIVKSSTGDGWTWSCADCRTTGSAPTDIAAMAARRDHWNNDCPVKFVPAPVEERRHFDWYSPRCSAHGSIEPCPTCSGYIAAGL